jgi:HlyD family secretion protein
MNSRTTRKRGLFRRRWVWVVLVVAVLGGWYVSAKRRAASAQDAVTYEFGRVERGDVRSVVEATGTIQPWKTVDIKSDVAGRIVKLAVDLGDYVKQGQLIALIDPTDTQVALDQAQADLKAANAKKDQAILALSQERQQSVSRVLSAQRAVEAARARLAQAKANMAVQPKLTQANINQQKAALDSALKSLAQARDAKTQLDQELATLQDVTIPLNVETVAANVSQAKANLDTAQADYNRQKELLAKGYVAKSDVETSYAKLATAQAALRTAEQRQRTLDRENALAIQELKTRIAAQESAIEEAQARVSQAQAALEIAQENRYQDDLRRQDVLAAEAAVKQAEADLASAKAQMNQVPSRQQDVLAAESQIVRSQAALKQAQTNLRYTRIVAPRSGVVLTKNVEEGTVVPSSRGSIGSTNALLQLGDTSHMWIVCMVDESDIGQINVGQKVTAKADAYPSLLIDGKVIRIDPQAQVQQNVTRVPVTVQIDDPDPRFKPGMTADCEFIVEEALNVLTVPNSALHEDNGVYTVQKLVDGKPKDFPVEVGVAGPDTTEIRSGLREGDEVITRANQPEQDQTPQNPFNPFGRGPRGGQQRGGQGARGGR